MLPCKGSDTKPGQLPAVRSSLCHSTFNIMMFRAVARQHTRLQRKSTVCREPAVVACPNAFWRGRGAFPCAAPWLLHLLSVFFTFSKRSITDLFYTHFRFLRDLVSEFFTHPCSNNSFPLLSSDLVCRPLSLSYQSLTKYNGGLSHARQASCYALWS